MRRLLTLLLVLLAALSLAFSPGCKKRTVKDTPEEDDPTPGPGEPPVPGLR
jgi:hypothetical protein